MIHIHLDWWSENWDRDWTFHCNSVEVLGFQSPLAIPAQGRSLPNSWINNECASIFMGLREVGYLVPPLANRGASNSLVGRFFLFFDTESSKHGKPPRITVSCIYVGLTLFLNSVKWFCWLGAYNLQHSDPVFRDCYTTSISAPMHRLTLHIFEISFCFMIQLQNYTKYEAPVNYLPFSYL